MEFTKNYSDELLMGNQQATNADLADFELPPYSGSSSGSDQPSSTKQQQQQQDAASSPTPQQQQDAASSPSSQEHHNLLATTTSAAPPNLSAVKDLLVSGYSRVSHVFHWRKPVETGVIFVAGLTLICALTFFSIISVVAYTALGTVVASGLIRLYKALMSTLGKSTALPTDHVWHRIQKINVSISPERMHEFVDNSSGNLNASLLYLKQVLLVEDKLATFKFAMFLYVLTYIGSWFNGMTLITLTYLALFSIPLLYENNKTKIDECLNLATRQLSSGMSFITNKVGSLAFGSSSPSSASSGASSSKKND